MAESSGIYRANGVEVELVAPELGPRNIAAAAAGRYDVCFTSVPYYLWALDEDPALGARFIWMLGRRSHMTVFAVAGVPASHGRPVTGFADLDGATFLHQSQPPDGLDDLHDRMWRAHLQRVLDDYQALLANVGARPGAVVDIGQERTADALAAGRGDVCAEWIELLPGIEAAAGRPITALRFPDAGIDAYTMGFVAGDAVVRARPHVLRAFCSALHEAVRAVHSDQAAAARLVSERLPGRDPGTVLAQWGLAAPSVLDDVDGTEPGEMSVAGWAATLDHFVRTHGTSRHDPARMYLPEMNHDVHFDSK